MQIAQLIYNCLRNKLRGAIAAKDMASNVFYKYRMRHI